MPGLKSIWCIHTEIASPKQPNTSTSRILSYLHSSYFLYSQYDPIRANFIPFFLIVSWGGVRLSPLGTLATNWPIVPALDDRWWMLSSWWNENWHGKPKYSEKTCPSATSSTTNPTWPDLVLTPGRCGGKPATNCLSYGTANFHP
jgi:hypothetical protein